MLTLLIFMYSFCFHFIARNISWNLLVRKRFAMIFYTVVFSGSFLHETLISVMITAIIEHVALFPSFLKIQKLNPEIF